MSLSKNDYYKEYDNSYQVITDSIWTILQRTHFVIVGFLYGILMEQYSYFTIE